MRTLIITTGTKEWLRDRMLPSLYGIGEYSGEVMIVNYGEFSLQDRKGISAVYKGRVFFVQTEKQFLRFTTDRFRAFSVAISSLYVDYDIIIHVDGNDIEFMQPIGPLLEQVKDKLLVVQEPNNNNFVKYWKTYWELPEEMRGVIAPNPIINAGMFLGPSILVYYIIREIAKLEEYDTRFGMDQLALNCLCYYYKAPFTVVDRKWDWFDSWGTEPEAKILHHAGVNGVKPNETDFVKNEGNWLFPAYHKDTNNHTEQPTHKGNWLFP